MNKIRTLNLHKMKNIRAKALRPTRIAFLVILIMYGISAIFGITLPLTLESEAIPAEFVELLTRVRLAFLLNMPDWLWPIFALAVVFGISYHIEMWNVRSYPDKKAFVAGIWVGMCLGVFAGVLIGLNSVPLFVVLGTVLGTLFGSLLGGAFNDAHWLAITTGFGTVPGRGTSAVTIFFSAFSVFSATTSCAVYLVIIKHLGFLGVLISVGTGFFLLPIILGVVGIFPMLVAYYEDYRSGAAWGRFETFFDKKKTSTS